MSQTILEPTAVPTATQTPGRTSTPKEKPKTASKDKPKPVKATIVLEPWMDEMLSNLAFARMKDRSELVRQFLGSALRGIKVEAEMEKVKKRFLAPPSRDDQAKSTGDVNRQESDDDTSENEHQEAA
jgi:hypothetical protein